MYLIVRLLINALTVVLAARILPGFEVHNVVSAIFFSLMLGIINAFIRPILLLLTLPISVITLGLFTLVINAFTFWLASKISFGVHVHTIAAAFFGALILWVASFLSNQLIKNPKEQ